MRSSFQNDPLFYVTTFLPTKIKGYKGLPAAIAEFYTDRADERLKSHIVVFHQRFTNTLPRWLLVQPFRYLAHNGEINTITANCNCIALLKFENPLR
ncbi:hypothetical protein ABVN80_21305 [Acinetobacter baumannii]